MTFRYMNPSNSICLEIDIMRDENRARVAALGGGIPTLRAIRSYSPNCCALFAAVTGLSLGTQSPRHAEVNLATGPQATMHVPVGLASAKVSQYNLRLRVRAVVRRLPSV